MAGIATVEFGARMTRRDASRHIARTVRKAKLQARQLFETQSCSRAGQYFVSRMHITMLLHQYRTGQERWMQKMRLHAANPPPM